MHIAWESDYVQDILIKCAAKIVQMIHFYDK